MTAADLEGLSENEALRLVRLHRIDPVAATLERLRLKAEAARHVADTERRQASEERDARRRLETTAPGLSAEDHVDIRRVMLTQGLDPFAAAVEVGRQRAAEKDAQC